MDKEETERLLNAFANKEGQQLKDEINICNKVIRKLHQAWPIIKRHLPDPDISSNIGTLVFYLESYMTRKNQRLSTDKIEVILDEYLECLELDGPEMVQALKKLKS
jgi:hypothetical protein